VIDIAAEIREILVLHLGVEEAQLADDARLAEDLGADSLDLVEILMSCEEKFGIGVPNRNASQFTTVGATIQFVEAQLASDTQPARRPAGVLSLLR
jgi:acyl carrier protein